MSLFINKAKYDGENHWWMYLIGSLISFVGGQFIGAIPITIIIFQHGVFNIEAITNPELLGIDKNLFLLLMLLPFIASFILLWLFIKFIHRKNFNFSFTPFAHFDFKKVGFSFLLWFLLSGVFDFIFYLINPNDYIFRGVQFPSFLYLTLISLLVVPIQTTFEEFFFRSYLMQGIGMQKAIRAIPLVITSIIFGVMHIMNPEIKEFGYLVLIQYISIGFLLGIITLLSDSMELAIGLHAANNIYACTLMSFEGAVLSTDTLFHARNMKVNAMTLTIFILILALYYLIIQKKYKMLPLKSLFEKYTFEDKPQIDKFSFE
jgi:uncharacterized protein